MKNKLHLIPVCLAALALCAPLSAQPAPKASPSPVSSAADSSAASKKAPTPAAKTAAERALPFKGTISSVDQVAKTFTLGGKEKARVFQVTEKTVLTKGGAAVTMKDVVANEAARGSYLKAADGTLEAKTVKLGAMTDEEKAASSKSSKKKAKKEASSDAAPAVSPAPSPGTTATP
ncbi:MAG TPA: hypothetical protein VNP98_02310 [Chthoniobacterales bacterium]|nr:hypothetical protein [Chthoniobacterales bacterium]